MDTLMKELSVPLSRYIGAFPTYHRLHPFEQALLELTVGQGAYEAVLSRCWCLDLPTNTLWCCLNPKTPPPW
jgi:GTP1/Obg family GTP-binding protein